MRSSSKADLTKEEEARVRAALRFLRTRVGGWAPLAKVLGFKETTIANVVGGRTVSASLAFRVARFVKVSVDDLLAGNFPAPGACPHCGHVKTEESATSTS
jgi:hypothetical protein